VNNKASRKEVQIALQSRLPELRKALGLSQEEFADLIGKSRQGVSLFERGERFITWETCLAIIAVAVNRDENVLMDLYGEEFKNKFQKIVRN